MLIYGNTFFSSTIGILFNYRDRINIFFLVKWSQPIKIHFDTHIRHYMWKFCSLYLTYLEAMICKRA